MILWLVTVLALSSPGTTAVNQQLSYQRSLGYHPCSPTVIENEDPEVWGTAAWPEIYGVCEVKIDNDLDSVNMEYVARHEVCHLSTGLAIDQTPGWWFVTDAYHIHPAFNICMGLALPPHPAAQLF